MATAQVIPLLPSAGIAVEAPLTLDRTVGLVTIGLEADAAAEADFSTSTDYPEGSIGDALQQVIPGSALQLREDLASTSDPEKGAGAVGFEGRTVQTSLKIIRDEFKVVTDFGIDNSGTVDITDALGTLLSLGGQFRIPDGVYLVPGKGVGEGGIKVNLIKHLTLSLSPNAKFIFPQLDERGFDFLVPAEGPHGGPVDLIIEGGYFDQTQQMVSTSVPFIGSYPPPPGQQGGGGTASAMSIRGRYLAAGVPTCGIRRAVVKGAEFHAGAHWIVSGGDEGIFFGSGIEYARGEDNLFVGSRDLGIYGSYSDAGVDRSKHVYVHNRFINCFGGASVKRAPTGFTMFDNYAENCVVAWGVSRLPGEITTGAHSGTLSDNRTMYCEIGTALTGANDVEVHGHQDYLMGCVDNNGAPLSLYGAPAAHRLRGSSHNRFHHNRVVKKNPVFGDDGANLFRYEVESGGILTCTDNEFERNTCQDISSIGTETTDVAFANRYIQNEVIGTGNQVGNLHATSYEERVNKTSRRPYYRSGANFGDGSAAAPVGARDAQPATGFFYKTNGMGFSANGAEVGGYDSTGFQIERIATVSLTTATVLTALDAGKVINNIGAGARVDVTLPEASTGLVFKFNGYSAFGFRILSAGNDVIVTNSGISSQPGYTENLSADSWLELQCVSSTRWLAVVQRGTWTVG